MRKNLGLLLLGLCIGGSVLAQQAKPSSEAPRAAADEAEALDVDRYVTALGDARRDLFTDSMRGLSAAQLEIFWGVYADYEKEKVEISTARLELVQKFTDSFGSAAGLSDADVNAAVHEMSALQKKIIDLRLKYFDILSRKLDTKTAGRFALTDDYISTSIRLDWLNQIPFPGDEKQ